MKLLNQAQQKQLLDTINPSSPFGIRDHALIRLLIHTGLRSGEVCALDIHHVVNRTWLDLPLTKGNHSRCIPLNQAAQQAIRDILHFNHQRGLTGKALLQTRHHQRLATRQLRSILQAYREQANLDIKASPHTLRHTHASRLASAGVNLRVVQKLLGHTRLETVEIYTHSSPEEMEKAVQVLE